MRSLYSEFKRRNVLRVVALYLISAWLIAQIADVVIGLGELPVAVGRVVLGILALGFPVALVVSWLFEWTPEGIRRESDAAAAPPVGRPARRGMDYVILSLLVVALGYFAATHDWRGPPQVAGASIAVLPFENRSAQPDDLYFTDGIHEDILTQLGKIGSLLVISRTSVMQYRDSGKTLPEIADELGVATILEGGVQRAGNRVRINLQLIDAATDRHLWAETYDRALSAENVFAIQSEIAASIADALHARLLPEELERIDARPTENLEAYDAYLLGRRSMAIRSPDELSRAVEYFRRAIDLDPGFALAHAALADALSLQSHYDKDSDSEPLLAAAEAAARKALELNPELGEAHSALGLVHMRKGAPPEVLAPYVEKGVALAPGSAEARKTYALYLGGLNRHEEALEQLQKAAQLDPMSLIVRHNLGAELLELGRREESLAEFKRALEIEPAYLPTLGDIDGLVTTAERLVYLSRAYARQATDPELIFHFVSSYLALGDAARADGWAAELDRVGPEWLAQIAHLNLSLFRSQQDASVEWASRLLGVEGSSPATPSRILLWHDLRRADWQAALTRYENKYPAMLGDNPEVTGDYPVAIDVAMLFQAMGQPAKADHLLDRSLQYMSTLPNAELRNRVSVFQARTHALRGDREASLQVLREGIEAGWTEQWWLYLKQDPAFDALRDDARFRSLVNNMDAEMARQLSKVRQLEASGEIALPPGA